MCNVHYLFCIEITYQPSTLSAYTNGKHCRSPFGWDPKWSYNKNITTCPIYNQKRVRLISKSFVLNNSVRNNTNKTLTGIDEIFFFCLTVTWLNARRMNEWEVIKQMLQKYLKKKKRKTERSELAFVFYCMWKKSVGEGVYIRSKGMLFAFFFW